jgi:putative two-component system response regulator
MRRLLAIDGYTSIATTNDPLDAVALFTKLAPSLVLLDLHMRPIDGIEVLARLKRAAHDEYVPVLMMTGTDEPGAFERAYQSGARDFLRKPFDRVEALARVRGVIENALLRRRLRELEAH